jgi:hypothetical protein
MEEVMQQLEHSPAGFVHLLIAGAYGCWPVCYLLCLAVRLLEDHGD